ncbi:5-(carboxyamino)imidazole ribonucleotide synthase [Curtobacterium sp. Leaf261]|uniref:5-(carboxyamino)imidazole ribonucleotide synthase n=1 Tax=Curtobacterium sp. Leaf261 TaxID=1736311 RepID=UPI0006F54DD6|nr:5-(carboxyamino)imidazole ribonucleotide synthase [Curtobacterium sp. Leaf261]KQO62182.1 phosphoribosylaminoimidazole carboxylase [Curtobacterium sp. Leaf261]
MALRVGVIGGGQLARMMVPAAIELGIDIRVLAEGPDMSASIAATAEGDYHDTATVLAFAETVDVVTFDHEHVPQHVLRALVEAGVQVHPGPDALAVAQDKIVMRTRLAELGLPVPDWAAVRDADELQQFLDAHGGRVVVKTARGGYDGKGVRVVDSPDQVEDWFIALAELGADATRSADTARSADTGDALLAEELVSFTRELAQSVARRPSGEIVAWPVVESVQADGVCAEVIAPAPGSAGRVADMAESIAVRVAEELGVTGVLAVELFQTDDERILINELAMRPHNTGHWSIDGATTSQFEQHLRAVLDLPLGATGMHDEVSVMINVLGGPSDGDLAARYPAALAEFPDAKFHFYGKAPRPGRKVGHVTVTGDDVEDVVFRARAAAAHFDD